MKKAFTSWLVIVLAISLVANILFSFNNYRRSVVVAVPDGDSFDLADGRRIRLLGIDSPEKGRCMADEARTKLVTLAQGRHVRLKQIVKDDFGRQLAIVIVEDWRTWLGYLRRNLVSSRAGLEHGAFPELDPLLQRGLLSAGFARNRSSNSNPYNQVLKDAQEVAKSGKLGIWSDECRSQTSSNDDCAIKGNTRAGKKYYYLPSCSQYDQVIVDRAYGDGWFCTEKEASGAGFAPATVCR